jgi:hypothetical protein
MFRPGGYAFSFDAGGVRQEADTFTCCHCQRVVIVRPNCSLDDLGGVCRFCMKMTCPACVGLECVPFEKRLEREEARFRALRSYES